MLGLRKALILLALVSCSKGHAPDRGDTPSKPPAIDAGAVAMFGPLVGTWSGAVYLSSSGTVTGVITVDSLGRGTFLVNISGYHESGVFKLESLDATHVTASAMGQTRTLPIVIEPKRLRLQTAEVGEIILNRSP